MYTSPADQGLAQKLYKQLAAHGRFGATAKERVTRCVGAAPRNIYVLSKAGLALLVLLVWWTTAGVPVLDSSLRRHGGVLNSGYERRLLLSWDAEDAVMGRVPYPCATAGVGMLAPVPVHARLLCGCT